MRELKTSELNFQMKKTKERDILCEVCHKVFRAPCFYMAVVEDDGNEVLAEFVSPTTGYRMKCSECQEKKGD